MNIELTQEQVEAFNRGESITITPKVKPKQWEPSAEFGRGVCPELETQVRLLAYVYEFGGAWEADWRFKAQNKYYIVYDTLSGEWEIDCCYRTFSLGNVHMSQECAQGLIAKLESGEVVL
jgi:hypothetical protein